MYIVTWIIWQYKSSYPYYKMKFPSLTDIFTQMNWCMTLTQRCSVEWTWMTLLRQLKREKCWHTRIKISVKLDINLLGQHITCICAQLYCTNSFKDTNQRYVFQSYTLYSCSTNWHVIVYKIPCTCALISKHEHWQ